MKWIPYEEVVLPLPNSNYKVRVTVINPKSEMKTQTWRLLNEGEVIQEGDEVLRIKHTIGADADYVWVPIDSPDHACKDCFWPPIRRPLQSNTGWVKLSTRKPTEADADEEGYVVVKWVKGPSTTAYSCVLRWDKTDGVFDKDGMTWHPLPKFEDKKDEDDYRAFDKWAAGRSAIHEAGDMRNLARKAWDAALKYARSGAEE